MTGRVKFAGMLVLAAGVAVAAAHQSPIDAGSIFRVFLKTGQALPSYGESAVVGDRVVFTLYVGALLDPRGLQLISLPAASVDLDRTRRYADAIRAAHYAATRGEVDYAAMTQEVQRALNELTAVTDPKQRLTRALAARSRLLDWARTTYGYRGAEVRELTGLFDEVIAELRVAAGEKQFELDLRSSPVIVPEPVLGLPSLAESVQLALEAARASDDEDDRLAILRTAAKMVESAAAPPDLRARVTRELEQESNAGTAYAALAQDTRARASQARARGDLAAVSRVLDALRTADRDLGGRRPRLVASLTEELEAVVASLKTYHAAVERYTVVRAKLLAYERSVRPIMSGFDGLTPVLTAVRDMRFTAYARLEITATRIKGFLAAMDKVEPPEDLADVHATFISALRMADHACTRRRLASSVNSRTMTEEASSPAAGAMLLAGQARQQLIARLYPPKLQ